MLSAFDFFNSNKGPKEEITPQTLINHLRNSQGTVGKNGANLYEHCGGYLIHQILRQLQRLVKGITPQYPYQSKLIYLDPNASIIISPNLPTTQTSARDMRKLYGGTQLEFNARVLQQIIATSKLYIHHKVMPSAFARTLYRLYIAKKPQEIQLHQTIGEIMASDYEYYVNNGWRTSGFKNPEHFKEVAKLTLNDISDTLCHRQGLIFFTQMTLNDKKKPVYRLKKGRLGEGTMATLQAISPINVQAAIEQKSKEHKSSHRLLQAMGGAVWQNAFISQINEIVKGKIKRKWETILYANLNNDYLIIPKFEDLIDIPKNYPLEATAELKKACYHTLNELLTRKLYNTQYETIFCLTDDAKELRNYFTEHAIDRVLQPFSGDPYLFTEAMSAHRFAIGLVHAFPAKGLLGLKELTPNWRQTKCANQGHIANISTALFCSMEINPGVYFHGWETAWSNVLQIQNVAIENVCAILFKRDFNSEVVTPTFQKVLFPLNVQLERLSNKKKRVENDPSLEPLSPMEESRLEIVEKLMAALSKMIKIFDIADSLIEPKRIIPEEDLMAVGLAEDYYDGSIREQFVNIEKITGKEIKEFTLTLFEAEHQKLLDLEICNELISAFSQAFKHLKEVANYLSPISESAPISDTEGPTAKAPSKTAPQKAVTMI